MKFVKKENKIYFEQSLFQTKCISNKIYFNQNFFQTKSTSTKIYFKQKSVEKNKTHFCKIRDTGN